MYLSPVVTECVRQDNPSRPPTITAATTQLGSLSCETELDQACSAASELPKGTHVALYSLCSVTQLQAYSRIFKLRMNSEKTRLQSS